MDPVTATSALSMLSGSPGGGMGGGLSASSSAASEAYGAINSPFTVGSGSTASNSFNFNAALPWILAALVAIVFIRK